MKCEGCINKRIVITENGQHAVCKLIKECAEDCKSGKENHYKSLEDLNNECEQEFGN